LLAGKSNSAASAAPAAAATSASTISIGSPSLTVGKP
jgi:hypothetical protein